MLTHRPIGRTVIPSLSVVSMQMPPFGQVFVPTSTVAPVMYDASGPATNATNAADDI